MKKYGLISLLFISVIFNGCAKSVSLSILTDEKERAQASAQLVRKIEVSYYDGSRNEKLREQVAVLGLEQPVALDSKNLKTAAIKEDGMFEAKAFTADGLLLLSGFSKAIADENGVVQIKMQRQATQNLEVRSSLLRKIRITGDPFLDNFNLDAQELKQAIQKRECLKIPTLHIHPDSALAPAIVFETAVKAPELWYQFKNKKQPMKLNTLADPQIEFKLDHLMSEKITPNEVHEVQIFSNEYEGCLLVEWSTQKKPIILAARYEPGLASAYNPNSVAPVATIFIDNPNIEPVNVKLVIGTILKNTAPVQSIFYLTNENQTVPIYKTQSGPGGVIVYQTQIEAKGRRSVSIYGILAQQAHLQHDFQLNYAAEGQSGTLNVP